MVTENIVDCRYISCDSTQVSISSWVWVAKVLWYKLYYLAKKGGCTCTPLPMRLAGCPLLKGFECIDSWSLWWLVWSGHSELSVILQVSADEGYPLTRVPLYLPTYCNWLWKFSQYSTSSRIRTPFIWTLGLSERLNNDFLINAHHILNKRTGTTFSAQGELNVGNSSCDLSLLLL